MLLSLSSLLSTFLSCFDLHSDDYDDKNPRTANNDSSNSNRGNSGGLFICPTCGCLLDENPQFSFSTGYLLYGDTAIDNSMCIVSRYFYQYCNNPSCYCSDSHRKIVDYRPIPTAITIEP